MEIWRGQEAAIRVCNSYPNLLNKGFGIKQSLAFSRAVRENFGQFSEDRSMKQEQIRGLSLQVSEHGMNRKVRIIIEL